VTARGGPARRRGVRFEQEVARYMGTVTTRSVAPGVHDDKGDIVLPPWVVECKSHTRLALPTWWRELEPKLQPENAPPLLVVKRDGRRVGGSWAVTTLETLKHRTIMEGL